MKILVLNCGSSSLKYQLLDMSTERVIAKGNFEITINSIILIASAIIAGMLGGIIGVNIKNR